MTIEELKIKFKNDEKIVFESSDYNLLIRLEKLLLSNGWKWRGYIDSRSIIDSLMNFNIFYLCSNYQLNEPKILSYSTSMNMFTNDQNKKIELTEEVIETIKFVLNPIPIYKPKVFDKSI